MLLWDRTINSSGFAYRSACFDVCQLWKSALLTSKILDLKTIKSTQNFRQSDKTLYLAYDKYNVLFLYALDSKQWLIFTIDFLFCLQIYDRKKYFFYVQFVFNLEKSLFCFHENCFNLILLKNNHAYKFCERTLTTRRSQIRREKN